jgi:hypothetical protein
MADLGQVPELDARVVAGGLKPVVARLGGDRVEGDDQVPLSRHAGGEPPGPEFPWRPVLS